MLFSLRNTLRSVSLLVATIAFAPGCDDGQMDALGLSAEQIDNMSEQELDELAEIDDLTDVLPPGEPDPDGHLDNNPTDLREPPVTADERPGTVDEIRNPIHFTHAQANVDSLDELRNPIHFTHSHKRPAFRARHREPGPPDPQRCPRGPGRRRAGQRSRRWLRHPLRRPRLHQQLTLQSRPSPATARPPRRRGRPYLIPAHSGTSASCLANSSSSVEIARMNRRFS